MRTETAANTLDERGPMGAVRPGCGERPCRSPSIQASTFSGVLRRGPERPEFAGRGIKAR